MLQFLSKLTDLNPWQKQKLWGILLILPAAVLLFSVVIYPLVYNLIMSFQDFVLIRPEAGTPFVGLENYISVLNDSVFWRALRNTIVWVIGVVSIQMILGVTAAILLNQKLRGRGFFRGLMLLPWVTPGVVAALTFMWMYDAQFGILNHILVELGLLDAGIAWLGDSSYALGAVMLVQIWKNFPFVMVLCLAALQAVPNQLYESAKVDGANFLQQTFYISLPYIKHTLYLAGVLSTIWTFNSFEIVWILTQGGPAYASEIMTTYVYSRAFQGFDMGEAGAIAVIMFTILFFFVGAFGKKAIGGNQ